VLTAGHGFQIIIAISQCGCATYIHGGAVDCEVILVSERQLGALTWGENFTAVVDLFERRDQLASFFITSLPTLAPSCRHFLAFTLPHSLHCGRPAGPGLGPCPSTSSRILPWNQISTFGPFHHQGRRTGVSTQRRAMKRKRSWF